MNLQTAEVYCDGRMLMPIPAAIADHDSFRQAFRSKPPSLCMLAASLQHKQEIQLEVPASQDLGDSVGSIVYDVSKWDSVGEQMLHPGNDFQLAHQYDRLFSTLDSDRGYVNVGGSFDPATGTGCHGCPVSDGASVLYALKRFDVQYVPGSCGWVSEVLDRVDLLALCHGWHDGVWLHAASDRDAGSSDAGYV